MFFRLDRFSTFDFKTIIGNATAYLHFISVLTNIMLVQLADSVFLTLILLTGVLLL